MKGVYVWFRVGSAVMIAVVLTGCGILRSAASLLALPLDLMGSVVSVGEGAPGPGLEERSRRIDEREAYRGQVPGGLGESAAGVASN